MISINKRENFKAKPQQKETCVIRVGPRARPLARAPTRERSQIQGNIFFFLNLEKK